MTLDTLTFDPSTLRPSLSGPDSYISLSTVKKRSRHLPFSLQSSLRRLDPFFHFLFVERVTGKA